MKVNLETLTPDIVDKLYDMQDSFDEKVNDKAYSVIAQILWDDSFAYFNEEIYHAILKSYNGKGKFKYLNYVQIACDIENMFGDDLTDYISDHYKHLTVFSIYDVFIKLSAGRTSAFMKNVLQICKYIDLQAETSRLGKELGLEF